MSVYAGQLLKGKTTITRAQFLNAQRPIFEMTSDQSGSKLEFVTLKSGDVNSANLVSWRMAKPKRPDRFSGLQEVTLRIHSSLSSEPITQSHAEFEDNHRPAGERRSTDRSILSKVTVTVSLTVSERLPLFRPEVKFAVIAN